MDENKQLAPVTLGELYAERARLLSHLAFDLMSFTNSQSLIPGLRLLSVELGKLAEGILTIEPSVARLFPRSSPGTNDPSR